MKYLVLSTYPFNGSLNSGDDLLEKSLVKLLKEKDGRASVQVKYLTDEAFSMPEIGEIDAIAGVISITPQNPVYKNNVIDVLRSATEQKIPIHLILVSKFWPITVKKMQEQRIDPALKRALRSVGKNSTLVARDLFTVKIAQMNGINCKECIGDIALYDSDYIEKPLSEPIQLKTVAISLPHNTSWYTNALKLAQKMEKKYGCQCVLTLHGKGDLISINGEIERMQLQVVDLSGGAEKLEFYKNVDMHVGFRLHAHIYCLRIRKPSVLMAEDSRSGAHLFTFRGAGCDGTSKLVKKISDRLCDGFVYKWIWQRMNRSCFNMRGAWWAIRREIDSQYGKTKKNLKLIDWYYHKKVEKFIQNIIFLTNN